MVLDRAVSAALSPNLPLVHTPVALGMGLSNQGKTPGRTTLLEAVNVLLSNIGEQPVSSLDNEQIMDARVAEQTILEIHKEGQSEGWSWNSETQYPFEKDKVTKEIVVPANVIRFFPDPYYTSRRFILRGQKVYDTWERSYKYDDTVSEVHADVVWLLSFDECPEVFNRWVTIKAARVFSDRVLTNDQIFKYTAVDEREARAALERTEHNSNGYNLLTDGYGLSPFPTYIPGYGLANRRVGSGLTL